MSLFFPDIDAKRKKLEAEIRPYLRTPADRASDITNTKLEAKEIAAGLIACQGNIAAAQRLLVMACRVSVGSHYVAQRVKADPRLQALVQELRVKARVRAIGGFPICPECGTLIPHRQPRG